MSIASEITRLQGVKSDILTAIADKGVTVPADSALDDCPDLISSIPTGGGAEVLIPPAEYTRLQYLGNKGSARCELTKYYEGFGIDILFSRNGDSSGSGNRSIIEHRPYDVGGDSIKFGSYNGGTFQLNYFLFTVQSYINCSATNSDLIEIKATHSAANVVALSFIYNNTIDNRTHTANDVTKGNSTTIFEPWVNAGDRQYCNIYWCKVFDKDNNPVFNLVPVKRVSDGQLGFYDFVDSVFYPLQDSNGAVVGLPFVYD